MLVVCFEGVVRGMVGEDTLWIPRAEGLDAWIYDNGFGMGG